MQGGGPWHAHHRVRRWHPASPPCVAGTTTAARPRHSPWGVSLGAKTLRDPLVSQLLGEWVASSPLAKARWVEATDVGYPSLVQTKQVEAVKQYASSLFPAPEFIGLLMDLNVTKTGFCHLSEFMTRRGIDYTAAMGQTFPRPTPTRQAFLDTWKEMAKPLELRPPPPPRERGRPTR